MRKNSIPILVRLWIQLVVWLIKWYVRIVDKVNYAVGRATMYLIFAMIGVLSAGSASITRTMNIR